MQLRIKNLSELRELAEKLNAGLPDNAILALVGELGAGKTAFTKMFLGAAGIKKTITSPTFVLMNRYSKGSKTFYHADLYRTKNFAEVQALGIPDLWQRKGNIFLIEWADKIRQHLPKNTIFLKFRVRGDVRQIQILNLPPKVAKILS